MKSHSHDTTVVIVNPNRMRPAVGPLGVELIAESLARSSIEPVVVDLQWEKAPIKAMARAVKKHRPALVGVSVRNLDDCYFASRAFLLPPIRRLVRALKEMTDSPVVIGGVGFSITPGPVLDFLGADLGLRGDGEGSLPLLAKKVAQGRDYRDVPGLVTGGAAEPAPAADGLRRLPDPGRGFVDNPRYFRLGGQGNVETQRGCNRRCIYCADPVAKGRTVRRRDPRSVASEMAALAGRGVRSFHLCDPEFNLSRGHAEAVCRAMIREGLGAKVSWYTYALPRPMDDDLAGLMARAGCRGIDFSADAADDGMLLSLGRDFGVADLERCARACRKAGIVFMFDLLLGGPGETVRSLSRTIERIRKIRPDRVGVSFGVRIFPGTALGRMVREAGPLEDNPCLHGEVRDNGSFLKPVFYVSDRLGRDPEARLKKMIDADPIFLFASRSDLDRNYNYNDNPVLCRLIRGGERGAYWDILRRHAGGQGVRAQ